MNRRGFLKGLAATAAGLLVPSDVAADPEHRVWALDSTMMGREPMFRAGERLDLSHTSEWFANMGPHDVPFMTEEWWQDRHGMPFPHQVALIDHNAIRFVPYDAEVRAYLAAKKRVEDDIIFGGRS